MNALMLAVETHPARTRPARNGYRPTQPVPDPIEAMALLRRRSELRPVPALYANADRDGIWRLEVPLTLLESAQDSGIDLVLLEARPAVLYRLRVPSRFLQANAERFARGDDGSLLLELSALAIDRFRDEHPDGSGCSLMVFLRTSLELTQREDGSWSAPYPEQFRMPSTERI